MKGRPGSGKSAIIKHIALKYIDKGWIVKPVKMVDEMFKICHMEKWSMYTVLFVLDDPFGKDSLNDIMYKIWEINTEKLMNCLKTVKLLLSCRKSIFYDNGILNNPTNIVDIDNDKFTLTKDEKQNILSNIFRILICLKKILSISLLYNNFVLLKTVVKVCPAKK